MARLLLPIAQIDSDGLLFKVDTPSPEFPGAFVAADQMTTDEIPVPLYADGFAFMNDGDQRTFIAVDNTLGGDPTTVTIETYATLEGLPIADRTVEIAAGYIVLVRPGPASICNQPNGQVYFSLSVVTDVTVCAVKV
jgi:hypothetical protein